MMLPQPRESVVRVESPTEQRNPRTGDIDTLPVLEALQLINNEDSTVPAAVREVLPEVARAVEFGVEALRRGGRVHYVGAGTSGRLASQDAAELVPTFNSPLEWFEVHHAGGQRALRAAVENAEDDFDGGGEEIRASARAGDFVFGLTASGRTPFVLGALAAGREIGAHTALMSANPTSTAVVDVDVLIAVDTGPEVIAGSTRMKAGTAQKLVLNAFSTAVMIKLGRTYSNLMVSMKATNAKLRGRTLRILREATGLDEAECSAALSEAEGDLRVALVRLLSGIDSAQAAEALTATGGHVRNALLALGATTA
ncbi:N-acetylmuramic acid 6-phosphate etherase [Kutzneria viridogrisea]|uniref:N-acetylmuramic acid 6-phosphate etherase n=2 Tax=Kutzneria viridogrisea TaxID=47990 RepID=A0ABR6BWN1_9PSEU|nr:N-acetylmuramic acid 6-phosphate etherase [Kutzneria viridogrisea]